MLFTWDDEATRTIEAGKNVRGLCRYGYRPKTVTLNREDLISLLKSPHCSEYMTTLLHTLDFKPGEHHVRQR